MINARVRIWWFWIIQVVFVQRSFEYHWNNNSQMSSMSTIGFRIVSNPIDNSSISSIEDNYKRLTTLRRFDSKNILILNSSDVLTRANFTSGLIRKQIMNHRHGEGSTPGGSRSAEFFETKNSLIKLGLNIKISDSVLNKTSLSIDSNIDKYYNDKLELVKVRRKRNSNRQKVKQLMRGTRHRRTPVEGKPVKLQIPKHCKPIPKEILWRKINPVDSYHDYLDRLAAAGSATTQGPNISSRRGRKRSEKTVQHSSTAAKFRKRRSTLKPNTKLLRNRDDKNDGDSIERKKKTDSVRAKSTPHKYSNSGLLKLHESLDEADDVDEHRLDTDDEQSDSGLEDETRWQKPTTKKKRRSSKKHRGSNDAENVSRSRRETPAQTQKRHKNHHHHHQQHLKPDPSSFKPLWHCSLEKYWQEMPNGTYPAYVLTGRCVNKHCIDGLYRCIPIRYAVNVMRKNEGVCNPLPLISSLPNSSTSLEESWSMGHFKVTVACECSKLKRPGIPQVFMRHTSFSSPTSTSHNYDSHKEFH